MADPIETRNCLFTVDRRGYVVARMKPDHDMTVDDAIANVAVVGRMVGDGLVGPRAADGTAAAPGPSKAAVLVDLRGIRHQTREARQYFVGPEAAAVCHTVAIVVDSGISRVVGNFFVGLTQAPMPVRLFTDEAEATAWLLEHRT